MGPILLHQAIQTIRIGLRHPHINDRVQVTNVGKPHMTARFVANVCPCGYPQLAWMIGPYLRKLCCCVALSIPATFHVGTVNAVGLHVFEAKLCLSCQAGTFIIAVVKAIWHTCKPSIGDLSVNLGELSVVPFSLHSIKNFNEQSINSMLFGEGNYRLEVCHCPAKILNTYPQVNLCHLALLSKGHDI